MMSLMSWGMDAKSIADTPQGGLLDDVWDAADLQVRNLDRALFGLHIQFFKTGRPAGKLLKSQIFASMGNKLEACFSIDFLCKQRFLILIWIIKIMHAEGLCRSNKRT